MKRLLLSALLVLLAAALHAQEFYRITDIDDDERALEVSAVSYLDASENRFGAQVAYEIKPLTAYFEVSFFSEHLGEEYGGIKYKAPSFRVGMDYGFFEYGMLTLFTGAYIGITPYSTEYLERDGWTVRTRDRKCAAHFEHTVAVGAGEADILSSFKFIEEVLGDKAI